MSRLESKYNEYQHHVNDICKVGYNTMHWNMYIVQLK